MISSEADTRWVRIGSDDDFAEDEPTRRSLGGLDIAVFRVDGKLYALDDHCSHGDASLSDGWVEGNCVECPLHQARFNLLTGEAETGPAVEPVRSYKLRTDGTDVFVEI